MADILITHAARFSLDAVNSLNAAGHTVYPYPGPAVGANAFIDVLWVRLERPDLDSFPNLKVLATNCTGTDHLPLAECERRGIRVVSLQDCREQMDSVHGTAEMTIALMLALLRNIPAAVESTKRGEWDRWQFVGLELRGKRVGIVGYGRVGFQAMNLSVNMGTSCRIHDADSDRCVYSLEDVLRWADIVTVHASLNETSRNLFNADRFGQMKPGAFFINTARGAIVDESALLAALESGHLAGAALDVVCDEPNVNPKLLEFARANPGRLILTPHIGGCTLESLHRTEEILAAKLVEVLK